MKVKDLIEFLKGQPQDVYVAYTIYSEQCLLEVDDIQLADCREPRPDGWVHHQRPDMPTTRYLLFPGH